jgi:hypothetical protein
VPGLAETRLPDGSPGPDVGWRNRVREGKDASVHLKTLDGAPLMASAFRGVGRTAAWAAFPVSEAQAVAMVREWAARTARPAAWNRIAARRDGNRILVAMPPGEVPDARLTLRFAGLPDIGLAERTPGVFEADRSSNPGGDAAILAGDQVLAAVLVPSAGDPEYAWPAVLPPGGPPTPPAGPSERHRALWAALAAAAWAGALLARSRRA